MLQFSWQFADPSFGNFNLSSRTLDCVLKNSETYPWCDLHEAILHPVYYVSSSGNSHDCGLCSLGDSDEVAVFCTWVSDGCGHYCAVGQCDCSDGL